MGPSDYRKSYEGEWRDFETAVLDGTPLAASAEYGLGELRAALAMYRSAASRRWEPV
jgi:predicted dehydrogenase